MDQGDYTIILADDSRFSNAVMKQTIKSDFPNANIICVHDGKLCLDLVIEMYKNNETIDGIFMDYHMPQMSGAESIVQIRKYEREHDIRPVPITAITADIIDIAKNALSCAGSTYILLKPVKHVKLTEMCITMNHISRISKHDITYPYVFAIIDDTTITSMVLKTYISKSFPNSTTIEVNRESDEKCIKTLKSYKKEQFIHGVFLDYNDEHGNITNLVNSILDMSIPITLRAHKLDKKMIPGIVGVIDKPSPIFSVIDSCIRMRNSCSYV